MIKEKKKKKNFELVFPWSLPYHFSSHRGNSALMEFLIENSWDFPVRKTMPWGKVPSQCEKPQGKQCSLWKFKSAFMGEKLKDLLYLTQKFIKKEKSWYSRHIFQIYSFILALLRTYFIRRNRAIIDFNCSF